MRLSLRRANRKKRGKKMVAKYKPILMWSLVDVVIGGIFLWIAIAQKNLLGIIGFIIFVASSLFKLIFAALAP